MRERKRVSEINLYGEKDDTALERGRGEGANEEANRRRGCNKTWAPIFSPCRLK